MRRGIFLKLYRLLFVGMIVLLTGCQGGILDPKGQVGIEEKNLILTAVGLMLLVVIPVIILTLVFAYKYRASNTKARYEPKWDHSVKIEMFCWGIPIIIIIILGTITWISTHRLDPYRPLDVKPGTPTLEVEAVSMDWKWLFIYPKQGIATVNRLVIPKDTQISFRVTSQSVMNSFFIPQLGSQIYSMAMMETKLHLIANEAGTFDGISSNYSGAGFTGMKFKVTATPTEDEFNQWVSKVRQSNKVLDDATYDQLVKPSENNPVEYFSHVKPKMFEQIVHQYMHMNMSKKKDAGHMMKATDHSTHGEMSSDESSTLESATKE
ncbi:ubiquinol oxidase subunit II [Celerinatantimonas sp. MCCC 1A17872]|uniref:ubiquinol oxidase subunit II n=1 Tax=Celerinatantimonas sp. MCCC 1A17872 TaxID=3177514 RepID=UPI0038C21CB1